MFNSFLLWLTNSPDWMRQYAFQLEAEVRGVPNNYDHYLEVWGLEQQCPPSHRVAYLITDGIGAPRLGFIPN